MKNDTRQQRGRPKGSYNREGKRVALRRLLDSVRLGGEFVWPNNREPYRVAGQLGYRIKTTKLNGEGYAVRLGVGSSDSPSVKEKRRPHEQRGSAASNACFGAY